MLFYGISYGNYGYIIQDDTKLLQGMIQGTSYTCVPCIYYREATNGLVGLFGHTFVPRIGFISNFRSIQVDDSLLL